MTTDDNEPIVITGAARTPMGGFQGELATLSAPELGGAAIKAAWSPETTRPATAWSAATRMFGT